MSLTSLSHRDDVKTFDDGGHSVCLNRRWHPVFAQGQIFHHDRMEASFFEGFHWLYLFLAIYDYVDLL